MLIYSPSYIGLTFEGVLELGECHDVAKNKAKGLKFYFIMKFICLVLTQVKGRKFVSIENLFDEKMYFQIFIVYKRKLMTEHYILKLYKS
jgi:hypothetical protein